MAQEIKGISRSSNIKQVNLLENKLPKKKNNKNNLIDLKESKDNKITQKELKEKVENLNNITKILEENLSFKIHKGTDRLMVRIINIKTQEVIKEMPPEEMLDLSAKIQKMVGLLIDEKV